MDPSGDLRRQREERIKSVQFEAKEASDIQTKIQNLRNVIAEMRRPVGILHTDGGKIRYEHLASFEKQDKDHARELYNAGWRCAGGIVKNGQRILFRGESHAFVSLEVWTEVERLTKVSDWSAGVYSDKGPDILIKDGVMHIPPGSPTAYEAYKKAIKTISDKQKERTQVTEVNEVPDYFKTRKTDKNVFAVMQDDSVFKFNFDVSNWRKVRSKGSRFLSVSNPLGETAAHVNRPVWNVQAGNWFSNHCSTFRHKKGGRRG